MTGPSAPRVEEGPGWSRLGRRFRFPLLVRRFPPELPFGFVARAAPPSAPVELTLEARRIPAEEALGIVQGARSVTEAELAGGAAGAATSELEVERRSAEELGLAVAGRTQELWRVGLRWVASASARPRGEAERQRLVERLAGLGFRTRVPRYEVDGALAPPASLARRPAGYWQTMTTDGLAALYPFGDESVVEPGGVLVGLALGDASPVFLDRWSHASHSWGIFGATGAGKSFLAALTVLRSRWMRPETELVVLDPLGEYGRFVRELGGTVVRLRAPGTGRLNPLDPVTTGGDRREKAGRVATMLRTLWPSLSDEEAATLDAAVSRLYDSVEREPTFGALRDEVGRAGGAAGRLPTLLEVFRSGSLRGVDGPTTLRVDTPIVGIDLAGVPEEQLPFHLTYLLDWTYHRLATRAGPKLVVMDEAHLLARHEGTTEFLDRTVRHLRHFGAGLLLLSQNPDDFLARASGRSLLRNLYACAFLRLAEVSEPCRSFFALTAPEAEWLARARLPAEAGYSESLWRVGPWHLPLAVVASTAEFSWLGALFGRRAEPADPAPDAPRGGGL
ncbi:MAG TPA: ATP-binding protein [Thermoplasmata archaeon]|nr:ATP-binding protein [Thermoplasmata archaeon]